jgi:hypothetical protein
MVHQSLVYIVVLSDKKVNLTISFIVQKYDLTTKPISLYEKYTCFSKHDSYDIPVASAGVPSLPHAIHPSGSKQHLQA